MVAGILIDRDGDILVSPGVWRNNDPVFPVGAISAFSGFIHPELKWNKQAGADIGPAGRLGILASKMKEGIPFLESLQLERGIFLQLKHAVEMLKDGLCSRTELTPLERLVILRSTPDLPEQAVKPLFINGGDLLKAGLKPGKNYSEILNKAAREQWKGKIAGRKNALKWLMEEGRR